MVTIEELMTELYKHKDEIGDEMRFIIVDSKQQILAEFNLSEFENAEDSVLKRQFKSGRKDLKNRKTTFVVA